MKFTCPLVLALASALTLHAQQTVGLPKAVLYDKAGRTVPTSAVAHFDDPVIVITYAHEWCVPCVTLIDNFDKQYNTLGAPHSAKIFAINVESARSRSDVFERAKRWKNVEVLHDGDGEFMDVMKTSSAPNIFFLDANHNIIHDAASFKVDVEKSYKLLGQIKKREIKAEKVFFDKDWWPVPEASSTALYYRLNSRLPNGNWKRKNFFKSNNNLQLEGETLLAYPLLFTGSAKWYHENGELQTTRPYIEGKPHGTSLTYFANGEKMIICNYANGKLDGKYTEYYNNGKLKEVVNYVGGNAEGLAVAYAENGNIISEFNYKNGNLEGLCTVWYPNGKLKAKANFLNGKIDLEKGNGLVWLSPSGTPMYEVKEQDGGRMLVYKNEQGETIVTMEALADGDMIEITEYDGGKRKMMVTMEDETTVTGKYIAWYGNGQKKFELTLEENEPYGRAMAWWENGTVKERVDFDANKFEYYDNTGQLLTTRPATPIINLKKGGTMSTKYLQSLLHKIKTPFGIE